MDSEEWGRGGGEFRQGWSKLGPSPGAAWQERGSAGPERWWKWEKYSDSGEPAAGGGAAHSAPGLGSTPGLSGAAQPTAHLPFAASWRPTTLLKRCGAQGEGTPESATSGPRRAACSALPVEGPITVSGHPRGPPGPIASPGMFQFLLENWACQVFLMSAPRRGTGPVLRARSC